jgi:hypothetical protein
MTAGRGWYGDNTDHRNIGIPTTETRVRSGTDYEWYGNNTDHRKKK